jgi:hypothetical protein
VEHGELITAWTIRTALICYTISLAQMLCANQLFAPAARVFWTIACAFYLAHVTAAFHFYHDWNHIAALRHTAEQTRQVVGIDWGGGLYVNYAFTALWAADLIWWWTWPNAYTARPNWISVGLHAFMLFMAINAVIVFETGPMRWAGVGSIAGLTAVWWRRRRLTT